ncbi:hypothetical protein B0H13DRAFT_2288086 [Mycena leptocephala]|nr:hypothetical protein B0H13DRAFT_2288086 [Mycena leptocephala]
MCRGFREGLVRAGTFLFRNVPCLAALGNGSGKRYFFPTESAWEYSGAQAASSLSTDWGAASLFPSMSIETPASWPVLPPPPPKSTTESTVTSPAVDNVQLAPDASKSRAQRAPEVDVRNIIPATVSRSMAPTSKKRDADAPVSSRKLKKSRKA